MKKPARKIKTSRRSAAALADLRDIALAQKRLKRPGRIYSSDEVKRALGLEL